MPQSAERYRRDLVRNARAIWGLDAPTSTFAAQIAAESNWNADAKSHVGASGIAQFMPATATWLSGVYKHLGPAEPMNPAWAMRAMVRYDKHIYDRADAIGHCDRMAKTLAGYNGGEGWVQREEALCRIDSDCIPQLWFGHVEKHRARAQWAFDENRTYVTRILRTLEPRYRAAGWGIHSCQS